LLLLAGLSLFGSRFATHAERALSAGDAVYLPAAANLQPVDATATAVAPAGDQSAPQPVATKEPPFNYTRGDIDAAQAKWLSHGPVEYEEVVTYSAFSLFAGTWKLHVKVDGGIPQVVSFERDESQGVGRGGGTATAQDLEFLTIEYMFLRLDQAISGSQPGGPDPGSFPRYYKAFFHPTLGYPTLFESDDNSDPPMVADAGFRIQVQSVKILSTAVPGMPRTGHP
jgi:hypothetical protein